MKGVVFNLLEECVTRAAGENTWDAVLDRANLVGLYASTGVYPDEELLSIIVATAQELQLSPDEMTDWFKTQSAALMQNRMKQMS